MKEILINKMTKLFMLAAVAAATPLGAAEVSNVKARTFSGSFKVYVDNGSRVKSVVVKVHGVVLDGVGYGSAYVKKVGDWLVTIE